MHVQFLPTVASLTNVFVELIVEVVGGVQSIVQSSYTAKQAKEERGGESLPKKAVAGRQKK